MSCVQTDDDVVVVSEEELRLLQQASFAVSAAQPSRQNPRTYLPRPVATETSGGLDVPLIWVDDLHPKR